MDVEGISRLQLSVNALQGGSASADGAQAGGLREGTGMRVHAADLNGELNEDARLLASIHGMLLGLQGKSKAS
jgi:hypothetical protein